MYFGRDWSFWHGVIGPSAVFVSKQTSNKCGNMSGITCVTILSVPLNAYYSTDYPPVITAKRRRKITAQECLRRFVKIPRQLATARRLSLGCRDLDELMEGGLPLDRGISEFYGEPGCGKTQISLQLMVSSVKMGFHCACINTEKKFPIDRLAQMISQIAVRRDPLDRIHVAETKEASALEHLLNHDLKALFNRYPLRLLVIDSVAGLFRCLSDDFKHRAKVMRQFHQHLLALQDQHKFAIVCTNQVASSFDADPFLGQPAINPCLGPIWTEFLTNRFLVTKTQRATAEGLSVRTIDVVFSPFLPSSKQGRFVIETRGLHSV